MDGRARGRPRGVGAVQQVQQGHAGVRRLGLAAAQRGGHGDAARGRVEVQP